MFNKRSCSGQCRTQPTSPSAGLLMCSAPVAVSTFSSGPSFKSSAVFVAGYAAVALLLAELIQLSAMGICFFSFLRRRVAGSRTAVWSVASGKHSSPICLPARSTSATNDAGPITTTPTTD